MTTTATTRARHVYARGGRTVVQELTAGRRMADVLRAAPDDAERVLLVGANPGDADWWLGGRMPDWRADPSRGHYLDMPHPVGRFVCRQTSRRVEVRRVAEWLGDGAYTAEQAAAGLALLERELQSAFDAGASLRGSPATTGQDLFRRAIPDGVGWPVLPGDAQSLIRSTSPQGRIELYPPAAARVPRFTYLDGRFAYAALTRELPGALLEHDHRGEREPMARARYRVAFRAPADWAHVGMLLTPDDAGTWAAPLEGETWADGWECELAARHGWRLEVRERLLFGRARPLDGWTRRLLAIRARLVQTSLEETDPVPRGLAVKALRTVLLHTIGAFHQRARVVTRAYDRHEDIPIDAAVVPRGGLWVERRLAPLSRWQTELQHPEWSASVWGRQHARLLVHPKVGGLLSVPREHVIATQTDAVYLADDPGWPDDGAVGMFQLKGRLERPATWPRSWDALERLKDRAEGEQ